MAVEKFPLSNLVNILEALGVPRSSVYSWANSGAIAGAEVAEEKEQKYVYIKDKERFKNWLAEKLGLKGVKVIEKVEQGVPFSKYEQLIEEIRKLEKEVAGREAEILIAKREKEELLKKYEELQKELEKVKGSLKACEEEVELRERKIRELSRKLKLKELEPVIGELPEDKRKALLKLFEEM